MAERDRNQINSRWGQTKRLQDNQLRASPSSQPVANLTFSNYPKSKGKARKLVPPGFFEDEAGNLQFKGPSQGSTTLLDPIQMPGTPQSNLAQLAFPSHNNWSPADQSRHYFGGAGNLSLSGRFGGSQPKSRFGSFGTFANLQNNPAYNLVINPDFMPGGQYDPGLPPPPDKKPGMFDDFFGKGRGLGLNKDTLDLGLTGFGLLQNIERQGMARDQLNFAREEANRMGAMAKVNLANQADMINFKYANVRDWMKANDPSGTRYTRPTDVARTI